MGGEVIGDSQSGIAERLNLPGLLHPFRPRLRVPDTHTKSQRLHLSALRLWSIYGDLLARLILLGLVRFNGTTSIVSPARRPTFAVPASCCTSQDAAPGAAGFWERRRLTPGAAGQLLGLQRRQVFRLLKAYRIEGPTGLISRRRGRCSMPPGTGSFSPGPLGVANGRRNRFHFHVIIGGTAWSGRAGDC